MNKPPATEIVVRVVSADDIPALLGHPGVEPSAAQAHFAKMAKGNYFYVAAFDSSGPLGTAVLRTSGDLTPELSNMYVFPDARRRGAGRALSTWIEDKAKALGFEEIFLGVDPNNEKAIPLYISLGYSPTGTHRVAEAAEDRKAGAAAQQDAIYRKSLRYAV